MASTAYDMAMIQFACHKSLEDDIGCAGFAIAGATHNLGVRLSRREGGMTNVRKTGYSLYPHFRAMAIANGVPADHPALQLCRDDQ
jgi:hypothetical protein